MRLDPLLALAQAIASRRLLVGSALALVTIVLTVALGRVWCGWICPLGTLLDLCRPTRRRAEDRAPLEAWRYAKYGLLLLILFGALFGNLTLLILDPLTLLFRALAITIWPAVDQIVTVTEGALYRAAPLRSLVSTLDGWLRPRLLPSSPVYYRWALLPAAALATILALNTRATRFWCRYLCPLGALLALLSKAAIVRRVVDERCTHCNACDRACPTATIDPAQGYTSDPSECTVCLKCEAICPQQAIGFAPQKPSLATHSYDPTRRKTLAALGASIVGVSLLRADLLAHGDKPHLLRPPGTNERELLSMCVRCGQCIRTCPTSAIQPALLEAGLEGLWTPVLIPRAGYCDYSCNACGQVCPVQAIPPLTLAEKRARPIGKAYIDEHRCIAWSDLQQCGICEEMCPVPGKAIWLESAEVVGRDNSLTTVLRPRVERSLCIRCGICEFRCPVAGQAAIRVHSLPDDDSTT